MTKKIPSPKEKQINMEELDTDFKFKVAKEPGENI